MNKTTVPIVALCLFGACVERGEPEQQAVVSQADTVPAPAPYNTGDPCNYMANGGAQVLGDATHPVNIYNLYWGNTYWNGPGFASGAMWRNNLDAAWRFLGNNRSFFNAVQQYGTGTGHFAGSLVMGEPPASVTEADVENYVQSVTSRYTLSGIARTVNDVYVVYLPPGVTSTVDVAAKSDAHHWYFVDSEDGKGVAGATIPWSGGDSTSVNISWYTMRAAHEIFEAMAHPNINEPGWREVGDPCEALPPWNLDGYVVPRIYSNRSCGCVTTEGLGLGEKDFNGDGLPDILWHNPTTGQLSVWSVGTDYKVASSASLDWTVAGTQWIGRGTGDFNGDRKPDVLWHNATTGQVVIWLMNGTTVAVNQIVDWTVTGTDWQLRGTGDFNRDGKLDLVWHNASTGQVAFWYLDGAAHVIGSALASQTSVGATPILSGTGDFDNDGYSDLLWHNPTTGAVSAWLMNGATVRAVELSDGAQVGNEWHLMGTQDFNDDGLVDLMWHNSVSGQVSIWNMSGLRVTSTRTLDWSAVYPWKIISR